MRWSASVAFAFGLSACATGIAADSAAIGPAADAFRTAEAAAVQSIDPATVRVNRKYSAASGRECIEFEKPSSSSGGRSHGIACERNGVWEVLRPFPYEG